jgi:hypothetical protein
MLNAGKRTKTATAVAALVALGVVGGAIPIQGTDAAVTMSGMELRGSLWLSPPSRRLPYLRYFIFQSKQYFSSCILPV